VAPGRLGLCITIDVAFEFVDSLPLVIELFLHVDQFLCKAVLDVLTPFVKIELDLAERLESGNYVVVEDGEVGKRLSLRLPALFL
jgi:hypothetical protein